MQIPIQNLRKQRVQNAVLRFLYIGGVLAVGAAAPKLLQFFPSADRSRPRRKELYARIRSAQHRLIQGGFVEKGAAGKYKLTAEGKARIEKILLREYRIPEPVHWDGKWRLLIFDIAEKRRGARERLRDLLHGAGFVRLQDSVWVHPYPCEEFVTLIRAYVASGVGELRSLVVEALEADRALREHFRLT